MDDELYPGTVESVIDDGRCQSKYNDGDVEELDMSQETWRFDAISIAYAATAISPELLSNEKSVLKEYL